MEKIVMVENGMRFEDYAVPCQRCDAVRIGNSYALLMKDNLTGECHVLSRSRNLKGLNREIDYESEEVRSIVMDNAYHEYYDHRNPIPIPPGRIIEVGSACVVGALSDCVVMDRNEWFYYVRFVRNGKTEYKAFHWIEVYPFDSHGKVDSRHSEICYRNASVESLVRSYYGFGIDMNPDYQRGDAWSTEQRERLIDSIFNGISIGSIVLAEKKWSDGDGGLVFGDMYEVIDGKQRLSSIIGYVSGEFRYGGLFYHELDPMTRSRFGDSLVMVGEISTGGRGYDRRKVLEQFVRLNECGTSMDMKIIENAKKMISGLE